MKLSRPLLKPCLFAGPSRRELREFPDSVRGSIGHTLHQTQCGEEPASAKSLKGFGGRSVLEIVEDFDGATYRAVYTVRFGDAIYVLHAFQKKSKKGIATPKQTIGLIESQLRDAEADHRMRQKKRLMNAMKKRRPKVEVGSGNIFADLGLPDAEDMLLKSTIVIELRRLIKHRKLTQTAAAKLVGVSQADLSKILRGRFRGYSEVQIDANADGIRSRCRDYHSSPPKGGQGRANNLQLPGGLDKRSCRPY